MLRCTSRCTRRRPLCSLTSKKVQSVFGAYTCHRVDDWSIESIYSLSALESKLVAYISDVDALEQPFDVTDIPKISREQAAKDAARTLLHTGLFGLETKGSLQVPVPWRPLVFRQHRRPLRHHRHLPQRRNPTMLNSSRRCPNWHHTGQFSTAASRPALSRRARQSTRWLWSSTSSRSMSYSRHASISSLYLVDTDRIPQFNVSNTIPDTVLEQVSVIMQPQADSGLTEDFIIPVPALTTATSPSIVYVSFTRDSPEEYVQASFQCILKFVSKELDPSTGEPEEEGYEDEYQVEETELAAADYIIPSYVTFASEWDRMRGGVSLTETFSLPAMESLKGTYPFVCSDHMEPFAHLIVSYSCMQIRHRDSQHATTRWLGRTSAADCAYITALRAGRRRWRQGARALSHDVFEGAGRDARGRRAVGTTSSCRPCYSCDWWLSAFRTVCSTSLCSV